MYRLAINNTKKVFCDYRCSPAMSKSAHSLCKRDNIETVCSCYINISDRIESIDLNQFLLDFSLRLERGIYNAKYLF